MNTNTFKKIAHKSLFSSLQRGFATTPIGELLGKRCQENKLLNALRFENQSKTWAFHELHEHSNAFALGLVELGYKPGDRVVFWLDRAQTSQSVVAQVCTTQRLFSHQ